ncbi:MAG TPA: glycosyltransferase family 39 protein [Puia sp.]|nr:glycosyltransferase family 39 protein [Puia sp.]
MSKKNWPLGSQALLYTFALLKFLLPYWIQHSAYEPHRDEFLYLAEARHLSWGYLEVPPIMSALGWVTNLMGGSLFWIRFWPSLFGALTWLLVGRLILHLGGKRFALLLGFLPFVCGYLMHVFFIFQPNFLEVFFWTGMAYGLVRYVQGEDPKGLYIMGVSLGLGLMSKYSVLFFFCSLMLGAALTPQRKIFLEKHFWLALLTAFILFLPNGIWQAIHGFPVLHHMKELEKQQLQNINRVDFLRDQLVFNFPGLVVWGMGLWWLFSSGNGKSYRFIAWAVLFILAFLTIAQGKSYYAMGAYPILFAFGGYALSGRLDSRSYIVKTALTIFIIATGLIIDAVSLPFLAPERLAAFYARYPLYRQLGFLRWEDQANHPLPQDFADMLGWKELTEKTGRVYQSLNAADRSDLVLDADNYGEGAALDNYGPAFHLPPSMGHAASYLVWTPPNFYEHEIVILTTDARGEMNSGFVRSFQNVVLEDSIVTPLAREHGSYIILLRGPGAKARKDWKEYYDSLLRDAGTF